MSKKRKQPTRPLPQEIPWHSFSITKVLEELKTNKDGLTDKEVERRLKQKGANKLPAEKPASWFFIMLNQFKSPLVYILLMAAIVSLVMQEFIDMGIILAAVVINTIVGFIQEYKANRAISHLKRLVQREAKVIRDGVEMRIDTSQVVPGDIIALEDGDRVPADARLIESVNLQVVEASLTGESLPSGKAVKVLGEGAPLADRENMIYMGTNVTRGRGRAVVCGTGLGTELGKIASLVKDTKEEKTPLQEKLAHFSKVLGIVVLGICFLIFILGYLRGQPAFLMFETAVAIAVAAIPEGLLVSVTVVLAIGMQRILKKKSLIRKLIAAETLGSTTVICSDKTGTLTEGRMKVVELVAGFEEFMDGGDGIFFAKGGPASGWNLKKRKFTKAHELALEIGALCNNAVIENPKDELKDWLAIGDPTEIALLEAAVQAGFRDAESISTSKRVAEIPFDSERKYMATLTRTVKDSYFMALKGAPEMVLGLSSGIQTKSGVEALRPSEGKKIKERYEKLSKKGLRVLALAYKQENIKSFSPSDGHLLNEKQGRDFLGDDDLKNMIFVGLVGLKDPVRSEAKEAIRICKKAGIRPIIITGDHKLTAQAVAKEIGIPAEAKCVMTGEELEEMKDEDFKKAIKTVDIFARVSPHHKLKIIDALQEQGEVVAMTGDGVNDAPAIKSADIGLALGGGTDVAKETADMILLDNNYQTIVAAVEQGRIIFDNIKKIILYLLSDSFSEMILIGGALLMGLPLPVTAAQILWINLITDGFPNVALTFEPGEKDIMDEPPRRKERIIDTEMKVLIFIIGIITDLLLFGIYFYLLGVASDLAHIQTMIFAVLGTDSLFYVFSCKSIRHSIFNTRIFSNMWLIGAVLVALGLQIIAIYLPFFQKILKTVPLNAEDWILVGLVGVINILAIEAGKWVFIVRRRRHKRELT